jgi:hypothetical protein
MKVGTRSISVRAAVTAAAAATAVGVGAFFAVSVSAGAAVATEVADDLPPFAVEDFNYPRAAAIEAERGFLLKRGDGHIVLAECTEANVLEVFARNQPSSRVCFRTTGNEGYLTLELPAVLGITTNDVASTDVTLTSESGERAEFTDLPRNHAEPLGESIAGPGILVEIRFSN